MLKYVKNKKIQGDLMDRKIRFKSLISYGVGDIFGGGSFLLIGMLYMKYLTDVVGLTGILAGLVVGIGKIWDAISDPLMGYISDNTRSKYGRRKVFFLLGIIPIFLAFTLMWFPISIKSTIGLFIYYSIAYLFFSTVFTMVMVPYSALNAEMTQDYKQRSKLTGARIIFSQLSALLAGTVPKIIINNYSLDIQRNLTEAINSGASQDIIISLQNQLKIANQKGYLIMAIIFGIIYAIPWILVFKGTWEIKITKKREKKKILDIFKSFSTIFINKSFRIHIGMYIAAYVGLDILMALFIYFLDSNLQREGMYSLAMGSLLFTQILMMPLYIFIGNKKGKGIAFKLGMVVWIIAMVSIIPLNPSSSIIQIIFSCILLGAGLSAGVLIPWAILPSVTDVDELITKEKRAGTYSGAMTLIRKMAQGLLAMPLVGYGLDKIGYVANEVQTPETLRLLKLFFVFSPFILSFIGFLLASQFKINPKTHKILRKELERLRNGGNKESVDEETKKVCEKLTGISYKKLYS